MTVAKNPVANIPVALSVRSATGSRERSRDHGNPINTIFFSMLNFLSKEFYKIHDKTTFHVATYIVSDYFIILLKYFSYDAEKINFI